MGLFKKVKKSLKRAVRGKFHIGHQLGSFDPAAKLIQSNKFLPKRLRGLSTFGGFKKLMRGNNSAVAVSSADFGNGYQYKPRPLGSLV